MNPDDWATIYRAALPDSLRPRRGADRLTLAAFDAVTNGWAPRAAAVAVARQSYAGAVDPRAVALVKLEQIVARPAVMASNIGRGPQRNQGCLTCPWHVYCPDPIRAHDLIPDHWARERFQLLHVLSRAAAVTEDEGESAMATLIADQRARVVTT